MASADKLVRCDWVTDDPIYIDYHDNEWGVPIHDDRLMFEFLILEGMQAGLSWITILRKRENFRKAYEGFIPEKVAAFSDSKIEELMQNEGIVRNRRKITASVTNAKSFLQIIDEFGSFDKYIWGFVDNNQIINNYDSIAELPSKTELSDLISKDLVKRGFKFVGSTIIYSFLQAIGVVDDHVSYCYKRNK